MSTIFEDGIILYHKNKFEYYQFLKTFQYILIKITISINKQLH